MGAQTMGHRQVRSYLTGKALSVFGRMSASEALVYDKVKRALLLRFRLTEEGFRKKFRTEAPLDDETPPQFFARLEMGSALGGKQVLRGNQRSPLG